MSMTSVVASFPSRARSAFRSFCPKTKTATITRKHPLRSLSSVPTCIRVTSDLGFLGHSLLHGPILRIADHHGFQSDILPYMLSKNVDAFCVGQAVTSFCHDDLVREIRDARYNPDAIQSHFWISNVSKGSSITFGGAVTIHDTCLALCTRVFSRINTKTGKSVPVSNEERDGIFKVDKEEDCFQKFDSQIPEMRKLELPTQAFEGKGIDIPPVLSIIVGPQHMNYARHVDNAFLADVAFQAIWRMNSFSLHKPMSSTLRIQYMAPGNMGQVLDCFTKDSLANVNEISIWGNDEENNKQLLVLAELSHEESKAKNCEL